MRHVLGALVASYLAAAAPVVARGQTPDTPWKVDITVANGACAADTGRFLGAARAIVTFPDGKITADIQSSQIGSANINATGLDTVSGESVSLFFRYQSQIAAQILDRASETIHCKPQMAGPINSL